MIYKMIVAMTAVRASGVVAIDATTVALGPWAGSFISILVAVSVLGAANGVIICGSRYLVLNFSTFFVCD